MRVCERAGVDTGLKVLLARRMGTSQLGSNTKNLGLGTL